MIQPGKNASEGTVAEQRNIVRSPRPPERFRPSEEIREPTEEEMALLRDAERFVDEALANLSTVDILPFDRRRAYVFRDDAPGTGGRKSSHVSAFHHMGLLPLGSDRVPSRLTFLRHAIHEMVHAKSSNVTKIGSRTALIKLGFERHSLSLIDTNPAATSFQGFSEGVTVLIENSATTRARNSEAYRDEFSRFAMEHASQLDQIEPYRRHLIYAFLHHEDGTDTALFGGYEFESETVALIVMGMREQEDVPLMDMFSRVVDAYRSGSFETIKKPIRDRFGPLAWKVLSQWKVGMGREEQNRLWDFFGATDPVERDRIAREILEGSVSK